MPLRIVRPGYKVLFLAGMAAVGFGLRFLAMAVDSSGWTEVIAGTIVGNALWILAVRSFRVREEDVIAPRPLWRLTGRTRIGYWMVVLHVFAIYGFINDAIHVRLTASLLTHLDARPGIVAINVVIALAWAVAYLNSSLRLRALARAATPPATPALG